jgi:ribosomal protein RSM22 (predicted rRNA methylase)
VIIISTLEKDLEDAEMKIREMDNNLNDENYKKQIVDILKEFLNNEDKEKKARYSDNEYKFIVKVSTLNDYLMDRFNIYAIGKKTNEVKFNEFCAKFDFKNINSKNNVSLLNNNKDIKIVIGSHALLDDEIEFLGFVCIDRVQNYMALNIISNSRSKQGKGLEEIIKFTSPMIETITNNSRITDINIHKGNGGVM